MDQLSDLCIDVPNASGIGSIRLQRIRIYQTDGCGLDHGSVLEGLVVAEMVAMFLARLVVDECIYPALLATLSTDYQADVLAAETISKAQSLLSGPHAYSRIEKGWGPGDGRPVEDLKLAVSAMADEYFNSGEIDEAKRCIIEMNAPYFHHEVVKRLVVKSFDRQDNERELAHELLAHLYKHEVPCLLTRWNRLCAAAVTSRSKPNPVVGCPCSAMACRSLMWRLV